MTTPGAAEALPTSWSAAGAASAVSSARIEPWAYVGALLGRYDEAVKFSNAVLIGDEVLSGLRTAVAEETAEATRTSKRFARTGPLASVPVALPPLLDIKGQSTHGNNAALAAGRATQHSAVVASLLAAGAELFARTNVSELNTPGLLPHPVCGLVKNPFTIHGVAGSGAAGTAVLVASHACPLGIAVDTAGEARVPAALCGVVGFRPTHGRYSSAGMLSLSPTFDTVAIMARTVEDIQLADAVLAAGAGGVPAPALAGAGAGASSPRVEPAPAAEAAGAGDASAPTADAAAALPDAAPASPAPAAAGALSPAAVAAATAAAAKAEADATEAAAVAAAAARCAPEPSHVADAARIREEAGLRLTSLGTGAGPAAAAGQRATSDPSLCASLRGLRVAVLRNLPCEDGAAALVFEGAISRLKAAGAEIIGSAFDWEVPGMAASAISSSSSAGAGASAASSSSSSSSAATAAGAAAPAHPLASLDAVLDPIRGFESLREVAAYTAAPTHMAPPPKPAPVFDEEGNEVPPAEPEVDPDDPVAVAAAAKAKLPKPLDSVVSLRAVVEAFAGTAADKAFLKAQLDPATAVPARTYAAAVAVRRPALQQAVAALFESTGANVLLYPSTPIPAAPLKATEELRPGTLTAAASGAGAGATGFGSSAGTAATAAVPLHNGSRYYRNARLAAAAGLPAITVPCGLTRPLPTATRGMPGSERLPVGLELAGRPGDDVQLLAVARAVQGLQSLLPDPIVVDRWNDGVSVSGKPL